MPGPPKMKGKGKAKAVSAPALESLKQLNLNAAGLDVGAAEIYACVPEGRASQSVRVFPTFTGDLYALADWLAQCGVTTVAMESTGVYWIPIFQILEAKGFEVYLVNAHHIKNVTGKKTDILDCQWIQQLHTYGLLRASFRPDDPTFEGLGLDLAGPVQVQGQLQATGDGEYLWRGQIHAIIRGECRRCDWLHDGGRHGRRVVSDHSVIVTARGADRLPQEISSRC